MGALDHYLCYKAGNAWGSEKFPKTEVTLSDQFQDRTVTLVKPMQYCNAVDKNGEGVENPSAHLTCYKAQPAVKIDPQVPSTDQFGSLTLNLQKRPTQVCVPTQQAGEPMPAGAIVTASVSLPASGNFDLYKARTERGTPKFESLDVNLADQWIDEDVKLTKPVRLGVATSVNEGSVPNPSAQLACYLVKRASQFKKRDVDIANQFGEFSLTVRKPNMLCVPSSQTIPNGN